MEENTLKALEAASQAEEAVMSPEHRGIVLDALFEREVHYDSFANGFRALRLALEADPSASVVQAERELLAEIDEALEDDPKNAEHLAMKAGVRCASARATTAILDTVPYTTWEIK